MASSSDITWWHFSDLHWEVGKYAERNQFFTELFKDLEAKLVIHGVPDFIVLSGDITNSGEYYQFEEAKTLFLDKLLKICENDQIPIFVVAGNHDISRKQARHINSDMITSIKSLHALNEFLDDEDSRRYIMTPFEHFKHFNQLLLKSKDENDILAWSREISIREQRIFVAGVNTSWASSYNRDVNGRINDERNLLLGQWQLNRLKPSEDTALSILIMHHPFNWLLGAVEHQASNFIQQNFDFVLFGHTHTVHELSQRISPAGQCIYLPSPAIYTFDSVDSLEFARGYNIVTYNYVDKKGKAYYYRYSDIAGPQFKPFIDLYDDGRDHYELDLRMPTTQQYYNESYHTYKEVIDSSPNLQYLDRALQRFTRKHKYDQSSVELYDRLTLEFIAANGLVEQINKDVIWESFIMCRTFLICELTAYFADPRRFSLHKAESAFKEFLQILINDNIYKFCLDSSSYFRLASLGLEDISLISKYKSVPEDYLRYYASFWIFNLAVFYLNYPVITTLILQGDPRIDTRFDPEEATNINIIVGRYDKSNSQLTFELRTRRKEGFLAVTTIQHYIDRWIKEVAEYWRHHHRIYPALVLSLEYPLWNQKDISGSYLTVEATPIIRLLMGRTFYGGISNIWFRELIQNALDANSTRMALGSSNYTSKIWIHHDGKNTCTIRDNGIGMSFQHIIRYLTTLGRSIWISDELDNQEQKQKPQQSIGKFGIGFVSVFQDAERTFVRTRFFRDIGEDGWEIDFTSVDKPFFVESRLFDIGTEVEVQLMNPLSTNDFIGLVKGFFLYLADNVEITPTVEMAKCLEDIPLLPQRQLSRSKYVDISSEFNLQNNMFNLRTIFCYFYEKENDRDVLPSSYLQISNAGVKVFEQGTLLLKPGKRYVWITEEKDKPTSYSPYRERDEKEVLKNFWVILDFKRGYSPILPSRLEIDINPEFSAELLDIILNRFCVGLEQVIRELHATIASLKTRRKYILGCLMESVHPYKPTWRDRDKEGPTKYSNAELIQDKAIELYSLYCPLHIQSLEGNEYFIPPEEINGDGGLYVLDSLAKTDLFKIYVRALEIPKWVVVDNEREFFLLKTRIKSDKWLGLLKDRDIYKDGRQLFTERINSHLTQFIRGDYALVDSDIFGTNAFLVLPSNLPKFWRRNEAASYTRSQVLKECPARVLLNIRHKLFAALDKYASTISDINSEQMFKLLLDNLSDSVIEQDRITVADSRWNALRKELTRITKEPLEEISYRSLRGYKR